MADPKRITNSHSTNSIFALVPASISSTYCPRLSPTYPPSDICEPLQLEPTSEEPRSHQHEIEASDLTTGPRTRARQLDRFGGWSWFRPALPQLFRNRKQRPCQFQGIVSAQGGRESEEDRSHVHRCSRRG